MAGNTDFREVRITLIGKSGVGKSASGNTILGANLFHSEQSSCSVTTTCQEQSVVIINKTLNVVDTPDFFYGTQGENLRSDIEKSVLSGVHVFLYVLSLTSFTVQEKDYVSCWLHRFGEEVLRYTIILFTHGDKLDNMTIEEMIEQNDSLQNLVSRCSERYHVLNNTDSTNRDQVMELLQKIDSMIQNNGDGVYTREMLQEAETRAKEPQDRIREEEREKRKHEEDLKKAIRETEDQVRKQMERKRERLRLEKQAEGESINGEKKKQTEREDKDRQIRDSATERKIQKWIRLAENAFSQLKRKRFFAISVFIVVTMGGINVQITPGKLKVFTQGCLMAAISMILGAASGKTWVFVRKKVPMPASTSQSHLKCVGVLYGFAVGTLAGYIMGIWDGINIAGAGVFGACGAMMIMMP